MKGTCGQVTCLLGYFFSFNKIISILFMASFAGELGVSESIVELVHGLNKTADEGKSLSLAIYCVPDLHILNSIV